MRSMRAVVPAVVGAMLAACPGGAGTQPPETPPRTAQPSESGAPSESEPAPDATPPPPTATPTSEPPAPSYGHDIVVPQFYVYTDGDDVILASREQGDVVTLIDGYDGIERESSYLAVAVRPGSTPEDLTVVVLTAGEGFYWFEQATIRDRGEPQTSHLPDPYQPPPDIDPTQPPPTPVWSPDGAHLAWLERTNAGETVLRTIGWTDDGPGTGDPANDNASFGVPAAQNAQLDDWRWTDGMDTQTSGHLLATTPDSTGLIIEIARQSDGALTVGDAVTREDGAFADVANNHGGDGPPQGGIDYELQVYEDGVELWYDAAGTSGELTLPDEIVSAQPSSIWMTARQAGVLIGAAGSTAFAYVIPVEAAEPRALSGEVVYAAFVD